MDKQNIQALIFDFGGTLDYDGVNWGNRLYQMFQESNVTLEKKAVLDAAEQAMQVLYSDVQSAMLNYHDTIDIFIYWSLKHLDIIVENYKETLVKPMFQASQNALTKNKKLLEKLSPHYTLAVLSNNFGNCEGWCKEFEIDTYLSLIIDSTQAMLSKPDPQIFLLAAKELNLAPEQCVYIGDKYEVDVEPVRELGMIPIWINTIAEEKENTTRIKTLEELEEIFL